MYMVPDVISLSNMLSSQLRGKFEPDVIAKLTSSEFMLKERDISAENGLIIAGSHIKGLQAVFVSITVAIAVHLYNCICARDFRLKQMLCNSQRGSVDRAKAVRSGKVEYAAKKFN